MQRAYKYLRMGTAASQGSKIAKDNNYLTIDYIGPVTLEGQRDGFEAGGDRDWAPTALSLLVGGRGTFRYSPGGINCP
jgi:hypothetical protein